MLPEEADAALIISGNNKRYFAGFPSEDGCLLVTREKAFLLVDSRYTEDAQNRAHDCTVITFTSLKDTLGEIIRECGIKSIMLEGSAFTLNQAAAFEEIFSGSDTQSIRTDALDRMIGKLRINKTTDEIEKIMKAQRITEQALSETLRLVKEGVSERDTALELEYRMRRLGAAGVSFELIVLFGAKTSMPHGVPGDNRLKPGDFITFDIGALYEGYHSDMTRTYAYGNVSDKQRRIYETVLRAQALGLQAVRAGVSCREVDAAARDYITHAGFGEYFGHSTGHGVGLDIHEQPNVSFRSDTILQSGMVITVEPGIYLPGEFGVRIEDMAVVSTDGCIDLATAPKELIDIS